MALKFLGNKNNYTFLFFYLFFKKKHSPLYNMKNINIKIKNLAY